MNYEEQYFDLLRHLGIHHSHTHEAVKRYVTNHMEELRDARRYNEVVARFTAELREVGSIRANGL